MGNTLSFGGQDKILVLAVHPDDETLGAGGLIQQALAAGAAVKVLFVTEGENNPWPQRALERRWTITRADRTRWGRRRCREALNALSTLGLDPSHATFMGLPDQGLTALLTNGDHAIVERFRSEIADWQPTLLLSPALQDRHPDHNALAVVVELALMRLSEEIPRPRVLSYLIHGQQALTSTPARIELNRHELERKRQAIMAHESQMALSRRRFLGYGKACEQFFETEPGGPYHAQHEIETAMVEGERLQVRVRLSNLDRLAKPPMLHVVSKHRDRPLRTRFALKNGKAALYDYDSNTQVGYASVRVRGNMARANLPLALFDDATTGVYLKLERERGFYDSTGWREARLQPAEKTTIDTVAIVPCYDVVEFCEKVIQQTLACVDHVIVINDGSTDGTAAVLARLKVQLPEKVTVITFDQNKGKGVALMAGFCEALNRFNFITLITLDADGQHPCADIPYLVKKIVSGAEMAIGERQLRLMPGRSRLGNTLATGALRWLYPQAPMDTQSGMRAFTRDFVEDIVRSVPGSRYETEFQILLLALSKKRRIATTSIPTIYIDNNRSSKFRPVTDSLRILHALIRWRLSHLLPAKTV